MRVRDIKHAYGNCEVNINQQNYYQENTDFLFYGNFFFNLLSCTYNYLKYALIIISLIS